MLLRGSSEQDGVELDLGAVTRRTAGDAGVAHGALLLQLAEALPQADAQAMTRVRSQLRGALGDQGAVDAIAVAAMFNGITRVADATGIPLDDSTNELTAQMRAELGIDAFERRQSAVP